MRRAKRGKPRRPRSGRAHERQRREVGASRRARTRQFCRVLASLNWPRFGARGSSPSAGQGVRRGAGIRRAQTDCLIAAVYKVRVRAMPRTRQNCSARQFLELSSQVTFEDTASASPRPAPPLTRAKPASPRRGNVPLEGATPAGGGKPSAADSEQTGLARNCRARFWAASPPASPPFLARSPLETRSTHLRQTNTP